MQRRLHGVRRLTSHELHFAVTAQVAVDLTEAPSRHRARLIRASGLIRTGGIQASGLIRTGGIQASGLNTIGSIQASGLNTIGSIQASGLIRSIARGQARIAHVSGLGLVRVLPRDEGLAALSVAIHLGARH